MLLTAPPPPAAVRPLRNDEFERLHQRYPNLPAKPGGRTCITCHGSGQYRWYNNDPGEPVDWQCDCIGQWALHHFLLNANIGLTYQRLTWADMSAAEPGALTKVHSYIEHADAYVNAGVGLILYGGHGTGKTALSALLLKALLGRGHDGYFTTFGGLLDTFMSTYRDQDEKKWFYRRIKNAGVLVLDDLGKEHKQQTMLGKEAADSIGAKAGFKRYNTAVTDSTFDEVLRHRVANSLPTIITTNFDLAQVQEGYGANIISLLRERSTTYQFTGADFRNTARDRVVTEVEQGLVRPVVLG